MILIYFLLLYFFFCIQVKPEELNPAVNYIQVCKHLYHSLLYIGFISLLYFFTLLQSFNMLLFPYLHNVCSQILPLEKSINVGPVEF